MKKSDQNGLIGCGVCVVAIVVLPVLYGFVAAYFANVRLENAVLGGFYGAPVGAGIAALVCQLTKGHREKAKCGPLPWFVYFHRIDKLLHEYSIFPEVGDVLEADVNRILERISRNGEASLTANERQILANATRDYEQRHRSLHDSSKPVIASLVAAAEAPTDEGNSKLL